MKIHPAVYIVIGVVALLGAVAAAYVNYTLGDVVGLINSADTGSMPPGTDLSSMQENAKVLGTIVALLWVWIISVVAAGALTLKMGIDMLKKKK